MAKRKTGAGGYPASSSDEAEEPQPPAKKAKIPYAPLRLSALGKPGAGGSLLPKADTPTPSTRGSAPPVDVPSTSKPVRPCAASSSVCSEPVLPSHSPTPQVAPTLQNNAKLWGEIGKFSFNRT